MNTKLAFLCGALRSGTSMTHLMLNAHPQISNPGEFDFFFDLLASSGKEPTPKELYEYLSTDRIFLSKNLRIQSNCTSYADALNGFVKQLGEGTKVICLNLHRNFDLAYKYFPDAIYLHMLRDPRDVSRSSIGMGWAVNPYFGVDHWIETEKSWLQLESKIADNQTVALKFEELVSEPRQVLTEVCNVLGLEFSHSMLDYDKNSTYSKPDASLVNQWKTKLSSRDVELVESKANYLMRQNGYKLQNHDPKSAGTFEQIQLRISNLFYRHNFAVKRYGFWLHASLYVCEKLKLNRAKKPLLAKHRFIAEKHLK